MINPPVKKGRMTDAIARKLKDAHVIIELVRNTWKKKNFTSYDSRSDEWRSFLEVISASELGESPVEVLLWRPSDYGPEPEPAVVGDVHGELFEYIRSLPLRRLPYENPRMFNCLGHYESPRTAIPMMVEALKAPPADKCPSAAQLGSGHCSACLILMFENARFAVDVFQE